jgi:hypothetical protein
MIGNASYLDYYWPDLIDHSLRELSAGCYAIYVNCDLTVSQTAGEETPGAGITSSLRSSVIP